MTIQGDGAMPALFVGHGSPMNAIESSAFTDALGRLKETLPRPRAILVVSAHWQTQGVHVSSADRPRTIHDFGGFPQALFEIQYPAMGSKSLVARIKELVPDVVEDETWGYDHGAWSVLKHIFPNAELPVVQLSLDRGRSLSEHLQLARGLSILRNEGVLILGSGNVTHNLRDIDFSESSGVRTWAKRFDEAIKAALGSRDEAVLLGKAKIPPDLWRMAHPTLEHYLPLLYVYGASADDELPTFPYEGFQAGSISMRAVMYGSSS